MGPRRIGLTPPLVDVLDGVKAITVGGIHTCAVTTAGGVRCWGGNSAGQLGDGTTTARSTPPMADVLTGVKAIDAGSEHTCALMTTGGVRCWGRNTNGQLGVGTSSIGSDLATPPAADVIGDIQAIAAGGAHTCVLTTAGGVRCWGSSVDGSLGYANVVDYRRPPADDALTGVQAISTGSGHTCALTLAGTVRCWGDNVAGEVGDGSQSASVRTPSPELLSDVRAIACGGSNTCALSMSGGVRCWGSPWGLGDGSRDSRRSPPADEIALGGQQIVGGGSTCVITAGGGVRCWGLNTYGQLGDGMPTNNANAVLPTAELPQLLGQCP